MIVSIGLCSGLKWVIALAYTPPKKTPWSRYPIIFILSISYHFLFTDGDKTRNPSVLGPGILLFISVSKNFAYQPI